jgi:hypothetical protein
MTLPGLVLVHGGQHAADCWDSTVDEIRREASHLAVLTVDLPGRRGKPGDLLDAHIDDWVDSVLADIEDSGIGEFVIVGHSLAGLTVPGVVTKLGPSRVKEMVLAAAFVSPQSSSVVDTLPGVVGWYTRRKAETGMAGTMPNSLAEFVFCNGMTRVQRRFSRVRFHAESPSVIFDKVDRSRAARRRASHLNPDPARPCALTGLPASVHRRPRRGAHHSADGHLPQPDDQ